MREIKFRAWDKWEKKMLFSNTELFDDMIGFRFGHFSIDVDVLDDVALMQFTGLKDKNGVEIYEGDIVKQFGGHIFKVVFDKGSFLYSKENGCSWLVESVSSVEVIGNIYENPKLIEVQQC